MNVAELQEALADMPPYYEVEIAGEKVVHDLTTAAIMRLTDVRLAGECYPHVLLTGE